MKRATVFLVILLPVLARNTSGVDTTCTNWESIKYEYGGSTFHVDRYPWTVSSLNGYVKIENTTKGTKCQTTLPAIVNAVYIGQGNVIYIESRERPDDQLFTLDGFSCQETSPVIHLDRSSPKIRAQMLYKLGICFGRARGMIIYEPYRPKEQERAFDEIQIEFKLAHLSAVAHDLIRYHQQYPGDSRACRMAYDISDSSAARKAVGTLSAGEQAAFSKIDCANDGAAALLWEKGMSLFNEGKYNDAESNFQNLANKFRDDQHAPLSNFYLGECRARKSEWVSAAYHYIQFVSLFPWHDQAPRALSAAIDALTTDSQQNPTVWGSRCQAYERLLVVARDHENTLDEKHQEAFLKLKLACSGVK